MKFSIVMTTFNRPRFLYHTLKSIQRQRIEQMDHEILVVDDGNDEGSKQVAEKSDAIQGLNVRYIHTGTRTNNRWRNMGFTANIGIRQARGEIVVLTNSDIYHIEETVRPVISAAERDPLALSTLHEVYDDDGRLIDLLESDGESPEKITEMMQQIRSGPRPKGLYPANPDVPFFLAVRREHLMHAGGYDEDFMGCASEDCDLLDRLKLIGCRYVYAPEGSEAIHLYHGRRSVKKLEADPGFAHNIRLREERKKEIVRNQGRDWGELINPHAPWSRAPLYLVIWVTSKCNLACPLCNQASVRKAYPDYEMDRRELNQFITSCQRRVIRFKTIELTGGEPTSWPLFEEGIQALQRSGITDSVTFITNGNNPGYSAAIANRYGLYYVVSKHQCEPWQIEAHTRLGVGVIWNESKHKTIPTGPMPESILALCTQRQDTWGRVVRQLFYLCGDIYYCCMAYTNSCVIKQKRGLYCSFEDNFPKYFQVRRDNLEICSVCLCNKRVWDKLP